MFINSMPLIIFNTNFIIFNTNFINLNTKFINFTLIMPSLGFAYSGEHVCRI